MLLLVDFHAAGESQRLRNRINGLLLARAQQEVSTAGAGTTAPEFKRSAKQKVY
jgi:hypothetical protein